MSDPVKHTCQCACYAAGRADARKLVAEARAELIARWTMDPEVEDVRLVFDRLLAKLPEETND